MPQTNSRAKKEAYFAKISNYVEQYSKILIVNADHVGSKQMADVRMALRGKAEVLMGKNTMIRCALGKVIESMPQVKNLLPLVKLNIGFVFCGIDPASVRDIILDHKTPELARQGVIAPCDVFVPAGGTGLDPSQTSFFQALGIATKIVRGQIEIQNQVHLVKYNEKVTASAASLLQKLNIKPFTFGLGINTVYDDGDVYDASFLDLKSEDILKYFSKGIQNVAAASLALDFPTDASISHSITRSFRNCVAAVAASDFTFPEMQSVRDFLKDPSAFAVAAPTETVTETAAKTEEVVAEPAADSDSDSDDFFLPGFGD